MTFTDFPAWVLILTVVFLIAWLIQAIMQLVIWHRPMREAAKDASRASQQTADCGSLPGVSIIVYSHNQGDALVRNLPVLLGQNYPEFEVIVLDDDSKDETQDVLAMMDQRSNRLFHTRMDQKVRTMSHRKLGVLLGVKAAHYDVIVMTQAQCLPVTNDWLRTLVSPFANQQTEVVLGPVVYERRTSFMSRFCQYDFFHRLVGLFGLTLAVSPFAGWGQNMAFRKQTFYAGGSQGFQKHLNIQPGEDDLFVAGVGRKDNTKVVTSADALMTDQSSPLFINWSLLRLDRGFTSRLYAVVPKMVYGLDALTRYLTVLPGLALAAWAVNRVLQNIDADLLPEWTLLGVTLLLLVLRAFLLVWGEARFCRALKMRLYITWPLLCDLWLPLVDVWFRLKALAKRKSFGVGHIGLR